MDVKLEDMLGGAGEVGFEDMVDSGTSFEDMVGVTKKVPVAPTTEIPKKPAWPKTIFETQAEMFKPQFGEIDPFEMEPIVTDEMKQGFMETLEGYSKLTTHPLEVHKGIGHFAAAIPGFLAGLAVAGQRVTKGILDQLVLGQTLNIDELYDIASKGMEDTVKFFEPSKEFIFGKPTPEAQLVGATAMAPVTMMSMIGNAVANWKGFEDSPNIRGLARFTGDISGFLLLGMLYRGPRAELSKRAGDVVRKADEIRTSEQMVEGIPDEAVRRAQGKVLEIQKRQVELEAEELAKDIGSKVDLRKMLKESLRKKGKEVKEAKTKAAEPKIEIPEFKKTEDALEFGKKATPEQVVELKRLRDEALAEAKTLDIMSNERGVKDYEAQLYREAIEVAEKKVEPKTEARKRFEREAKKVDEEFEAGIKSLKEKFGIKEWKPELPVSEMSPKEFKKKAKKGPELTEARKEFERKAKEIEAEFEAKWKPLKEKYGIEEPTPKSPETKVDWFGEREPTGEQYMVRESSTEGFKWDVVDKKSGEVVDQLRADEPPSEYTIADPSKVYLPKDRQLRKEALRREPTIELDRQTGVEVPEIKGERSPFFQNREEASAFKKIYDERSKAVSEDVELFTQKLINDANSWYHGDESISITNTRNALSRLSTKANEFRMDFLKPEDHLLWKETVSDAAEWARGLRSIIEQREGPTLYTGLPLDAMGKAIVDGAKRFKGYIDYARGVKRFKPLDAARLLNQEFKRNFVDRSGNIRLELLEKLGDVGYDIIQKMYLTKGANALSANMLQQMRKEVYSGLTKAEKAILDNVILAERMVDIGKYKTAKEFKFPKGLEPTETAAYLELFPQLEKLTSDRAQIIKDRARAHFEWMKKPLKDMLDAELISQEEYNNLVSHNYRRIRLVDIFDKRYQAKVGKKKRTIYDSGVEALAKGRDTDIFEPSSEIMALEVFNRAYGRILNNEANRSLLGLARSDPKNPFVRHRVKGQSIPSGWQRIFVYEGGERKAIYLSPDMAKEWITNNPEMSYRLGQFLRYTSGSPVLRTFATGINWGFALANLPRDVMHTYFAARIFDGKKWKGVYSPHLPIFIPQISADLARIFTDAATRGTRYQKYAREGGGMEFLVHQGRPFARGRRIEGSFDKVMDFMGYFGETTEIMTRLAIRDRVIRRRAKERGITLEEARKNKDITREATFAARDYMDFGQGGGITKASDNALPYINATVQGTRGLWRVAVENPITFAYKVAQIGAATTLMYAASRNHAPKTTEALQGDIDMQNNICIPLGDGFSFEDEKGQTRYIYFKVPLDPSQKFFKSFFEAAYDKTYGYEVDIDRVINNLLEQSPVGTTSLPPTVSGGIAYLYNKDLWLNEDVWKKTDKPLDWPGSREEHIPGRTSEFFTDVGEVTGLSPERAQRAVEELTTSGTLWSYLLGKGYDELFADVPKEKREQHIAMVLSEVPISKRFIGVTNPYSKYATEIEKEADRVSGEHWKQRRELDRLTEGYLFEKSVERGEVFKYIKSFKDPRVTDRLQSRFDFQYAIRNLPERSFWMRLQHLDPEIRARRYYVREQSASPEERKQLARERSIIGSAGGFFSDTFFDELNNLRRSKKDVE